jgi:thiol:disulfide interchange protein DsbD
VGGVASAPDHVRLIWEIADGYYLYRARIKISSPSQAASLSEIQMPTGQTKNDEYFGKQEIYHHELVVNAKVTRSGQGPLELPVQVTYQGCAEAGLCYPPITKTFNISLPASGASTTAPTSGNAAVSPSSHLSEQDWYAGLGRSGNLFAMLGIFFVGGLAVSLTPCVLPMVSILFAIIAGEGTNLSTRRAFSLSLSYVLGMAFTYTIAGAIFAAAGGQAQAAFQQPWIIGLFAAILVALALSMFGLFTLEVPAAIQSRVAGLSNRQSAGTYGGVAIMGALSSLIVTACVAPVLVGALMVIGQMGQIGRGAAALFCMSLGMGAPLLVMGASQGKLLPKTGPWMETAKKLSGMMLLGVAAWMLERVVPGQIAVVLWAVPALGTAWLLFTAVRGNSIGAWAGRLIALGAGLYGTVLLAGGALGGTDPLAPIPALAGPAHELPFRTIKSVADLNREVTAAASQGKGVVVDFYADWCTSCKEMQKYTFTNASVQSALAGTILLRADVTANDADDQALLKHFGIFGPPTIAFFSKNGVESPDYRVVGYMNAATFAARAREALNTPAAPHAPPTGTS